MKNGVFRAGLLMGGLVSLLLSSCRPTPTPPPSPPPPTLEVPQPYRGMKNIYAWDDPQGRAAGEAIYAQYCGTCHGPKGDGKGVAAAKQVPPPTDFTRPYIRGRFEDHPDFIFWTLSEGRPRTSMPPFKFVLNEDQRWQVLTYLYGLSRK